MPIAHAFQEVPGLLVVVAGLLGLLIGSFLNVVIYRLPIMMERSWRRECQDFLSLEIDQDKAQLDELNSSLEQLAPDLQQARAAEHAATSARTIRR